ncbi:hypothetical protein ACET3Z_027915 [Daucus carota]
MLLSITIELGHEEVVDNFDFADLKSKQKSSEDLAIVDDADGVQKDDATPDIIRKRKGKCSLAAVISNGNIVPVGVAVLQFASSCR